MKDDREKEFVNLEREVFRALDHQIRRDILKYVGEKKRVTFTNIMNAVKMPDSPTLSYHLKSLSPFIDQRDGKYCLTPLGKDAYNLLLAAASYSKLILHMGMTMTEEEHDRWHREHKDKEITPEQHEALMRKMGISDDEDREWHKKHGMPEMRGKEDEAEQKQVNPFAIGGGFLEYCIKQGWIIREGKGRNTRYYATEEGKEALSKFGIKI